MESGYDRRQRALIRPVPVQTLAQAERQFDAGERALFNGLCFQHHEFGVVADDVIDQRNQVAVAFRGIRGARHEAGFLHQTVGAAEPLALLACLEIHIAEMVQAQT